MRSSQNDAVISRRTLRQAQALYGSLADCLATAIESFRAHGTLDDANADLLRRYQKSLLMVLDFDSQLARKCRSDADVADRPLDLAAARSEVARRLDRLAAAAGA